MTQPLIPVFRASNYQIRNFVFFLVLHIQLYDWELKNQWNTRRNTVLAETYYFELFFFIIISPETNNEISWVVKIFLQNLHNYDRRINYVILNWTVKSKHRREEKGRCLCWSTFSYSILIKKRIKQLYLTGAIFQVHQLTF